MRGSRLTVWQGNDVDVPIYLDNHATTRVDPRVVEAMLPYFTETFGNAGSVNHSFGTEAKEAVDAARESIAAAIGAEPREIVFTSGATESNNLAIRGVAERDRGARATTSSASRPSTRPCSIRSRRLARRGFEVTLLDVEQHGSPRAGWLDPQKVADALRDDTLLVCGDARQQRDRRHSAARAKSPRSAASRGVLLHCDATQAVGKIPVDVARARRRSDELHRPQDLRPEGHRRAVRPPPRSDRPAWTRRSTAAARKKACRSGTLNVPGIVGFAKALELCLAEMPTEIPRLAALRQRLWDRLAARSRRCHA